MNTLSIKILNRLRLLSRLNIQGRIILNGNSFVIPILGSVGYDNLFMSEPWMIQLLKIILPIEGNRFVDVGVNVGQTLLKLRSVCDDFEYVGFEPNPLCVAYTKALMDANNIKKAELIPVGIYRETELGRLNFYQQGGTDSMASIIQDFRPGLEVCRSEFIPLFDLQDIKSAFQFDAISVLKVDVEGAELEVIKSFRKEISDYLPIILLEILPAYQEANVRRIERQTEIQSILRNLGYTFFHVIKLDDQLISLRHIEEVGIHSNLGACDYAMVPNGKIDAFLDYCASNRVEAKYPLA